MRSPDWLTHARARASATSWTEVLAAAGYLAAVGFFLVAIWGFHGRNTGFTSLIRFGDQFYHRALPAVREVPHVTYPNSSGYDGQFYAQLATEPLLRNRALDVALDGAPYRARRMLFAWTAYIAGLGRPEWVLKAYAAQNIVAWLALAWLMIRWLPPSRPRNIVPWIGCLFGVGLLSSVTDALLDGPSMLVIVLALVAQERGHRWLAAGIMGASGLGRETNLVASPLLWRRRPSSARQWLAEAARLALLVLPLVLWTLYVRSVFSGHVEPGPTNLAAPFVGYVSKWRAAVAHIAAEGLRTDGLDALLVVVSLTVQAVFLAARWNWRDAWWRMAAPYVLLMAVTAVIVWEGTPGAAPRVLLPMTFGFNVLIAGLPGKWFWPLAIGGNLSVYAGIPFIIAS